jgi:hypothetical protein
MPSRLGLQQPAVVHFYNGPEPFRLLSIDLVIIVYTTRDYQRVIFVALVERVHGCSTRRRYPLLKLGSFDGSQS